MPDEEKITIEVDDKPTLEAIKRANAGFDSMEGKAKTVIDNAGRAWQVYGDVIVRVADRSKSSIDRLVASLEKQAKTYGLSGVDKLKAQEEALLKRYAGEQRAIEAITFAFKEMKAVEENASHAKAEVDQLI